MAAAICNLCKKINFIYEHFLMKQTLKMNGFADEIANRSRNRASMIHTVNYADPKPKGKHLEVLMVVTFPYI